MEMETICSGLAGKEMEAIRSALAVMDIFCNEANTSSLSGTGEKAKGGTTNPCPPRDDEDEDEDEDDEEDEEEEEEDDYAEEQFASYRRSWERCYKGIFGSFEDETTLAPMRHTFGPIPSNAQPDSSLQIFSIRVTDLKAGLNWPLEVCGYVATRDSADHKRNYLFKCTRDNCQTLTQKDPLLLLTGLSRAVVFIDPVGFEIQLKLKGKTESEDEVLALKTFYFHTAYNLEDGIRTYSAHKRCTLEFQFAVLEYSVEATVSVKVVEGSWPDHLRGQVLCYTDSIKEGKMVLLDIQDGKVPINLGGTIKLSRRVVCVDYPKGKLVVSVIASRPGFYARTNTIFRLKESGTSEGMCDVGFCKMQVTIAWSLHSGLGYW